MPRMTTDLLVKCTGQAKRKRDESLEQFLRRITHLYCSERGIETIVSIQSLCKMDGSTSQSFYTHNEIIIILYIFNNYRKDFRLAEISQFSISTTTSSLA